MTRTLLGMLTPSSNTVLEPVTCDMLREVPEASAHFGRFAAQVGGAFADGADDARRVRHRRCGGRVHCRGCGGAAEASKHRRFSVK